MPDSFPALPTTVSLSRQASPGIPQAVSQQRRRAAWNRRVMRVLQRAGMAAGTAALTLGLLPAVAGDGSPGLGSIGVAQASSVTVTPSSVGANAPPTVRISGSGFSPEDDVAI
ncbi:MAG: hypothetical protein ACO3CU_03325, partial [Candidatus Nanopelagicales bacterium]